MTSFEDNLYWLTRHHVHNKQEFREKCWFWRPKVCIPPWWPQCYCTPLGGGQGPNSFDRWWCSERVREGIVVVDRFSRSFTLFAAVSHSRRVPVLNAWSTAQIFLRTWQWVSQSWARGCTATLSGTWTFDLKIKLCRLSHTSSCCMKWGEVVQLWVELV